MQKDNYCQCFRHIHLKTSVYVRPLNVIVRTVLWFVLFSFKNILEYIGTLFLSYEGTPKISTCQFVPNSLIN